MHSKTKSKEKVSDMKQINDEIKLTLNLMQTDIDDGAHGELLYHMACLLEIKRKEIQQRLVERSWAEPVTHDEDPHNSVTLDGQIAYETKKLTTEELKAGNWFVDSSEECRKALIEKDIVARNAGLPVGEMRKYCNLLGAIVLMTPSQVRIAALKQIHLNGNEFYWGDA